MLKNISMFVILLLFLSNLQANDKVIVITTDINDNINFTEDIYNSNKINFNNNAINTLNSKYNLLSARKLKQNYPVNNQDIFILKFSTEKSAQEIINDFNNNPKIKGTEKILEGNDFIITSNTTPNDAKYSQQLALPVMDFPEAWDISTGSVDVKVAILDSELEWRHPDFEGNIWQNLGEDYDNDGHVLEYNSGTGEWEFDSGDINNYDDDGNGFDDDLIGWDFKGNDNSPQGGYSIHGTQVSSVVGAHGNNTIHVSGTNWTVSLLGLRVGVFFSEVWGNAIEAIDYCETMGIEIVNMSWGDDDYNITALREKVQQAYNDYNILFVAAAHNHGTTTKHYPAAWDEVMAMAATMLDDSKKSDSNYGTWIEATATVEKNGFLEYTDTSYTSRIFNGATSTASPLAAGLAALIKDIAPNIENWMIRDVITSTCDNIDSENPSYIGKLGAGRINAYEALDLIDSAPSIPQNFDGEWSSNHPKITWDANDEADLTQYYILKSTGGGYSVFDSTTNTYYVDVSENKYSYPYTKTYVYYKAQACDIIGNTSQETAYERFPVNAPEQSENEFADLSEIERSIPDKYELSQNHPNPFNPVTQIKFGLPEPGFTTLKIYNINGQLVTTLIDKNMDAGYHFARFDGATLSSGIYFYELNSGSFKQLKRMLLLK